MSKAVAKQAALSCLDVESWRIFSKEEMRVWLDEMTERNGPRKKGKPRGGLLAVRYKLSPVDVYCYLKARFGDPNGFQTFLAADDSENWIHWDYNLKAGSVNLIISGTSREIHFLIHENLTDQDWKTLILAIKSDYQRVGKKAAIFKSLQKWVIFPNKFVDVAKTCSYKHSFITDYLADKPQYQSLKADRAKKDHKAYAEITSAANKRRSDMAQNALELSLLTPVMAEAFINMLVLILCKKSIRDNSRQFEAFIRSSIDVKIFDIPYKCNGFVRSIEPNSETYKNFKRVMDKRNHAIHGNIDPEKEQTETVYFEGKRPLFKESGDHVGKFIEMLERQAQPEVIIKDYEDTYAFLLEISSCLETELHEQFWRIMEDSYPGYDVNRKITGVLFSDVISVGIMQGLRYDDDLAVSWVD
jgi:hypothetical protein